MSEEKSMKRLWLGIAAVGAAAVLGGCPIYPDNSGSYRVCNASGCYDCPNDSYTRDSCVPWTCSSSYDCGYGYECRGGYCVTASGNYDSGTSNTSCVKPSDCTSGYVCGTDDSCHYGDCANWGCPSGYVCKLSNGSAVCTTQAPPPDSGGGDDASTDSGGGDASKDSASDAPADSSGGDAAADTSTPQACNADTDCTQIGDKCLDGTCTGTSGQCSVSVSCASGETCVSSVCTPNCSGSISCPNGYACDFNQGVCSINPSPCTTSVQCQGGAVCVETHCVPPCSDGGACGAGICVNGGCIPEQKP